MVRCKFKVSPGPSRTSAHRFYCTNIDVLNGWLPEVPETHKAELEESIQKSRSLADAMFGTHSGRDDGGRSYLDVLPVVFCMNGFGMFRYEVIPQYISLRFSRLRTLGVSFPKRPKSWQLLAFIWVTWARAGFCGAQIQKKVGVEYLCQGASSGLGTTGPGGRCSEGGGTSTPCPSVDHTRSMQGN